MAVRQRAGAAGDVGGRWLDALPDLVTGERERRRDGHRLHGDRCKRPGLPSARSANRHGSGGIWQPPSQSVPSSWRVWARLSLSVAARRWEGVPDGAPKRPCRGWQISLDDSSLNLLLMTLRAMRGRRRSALPMVTPVVGALAVTRMVAGARRREGRSMRQTVRAPRWAIGRPGRPRDGGRSKGGGERRSHSWEHGPASDSAKRSHH